MKKVVKAKKKKLSEGITLIALVVTIVVLLILAGVSIQMLAGEDGIIKRGGEAKEETVIGQEKEQIEMAYVSAAINNLSGSITEDNLRTELDKILDDTGKEENIKKTKVKTNNDKTLNVLFKETSHNYNVDNKGKVRLKKNIDYPTLATETTISNYGDYVNYNMDYDNDGDTSDDWRIFYNDGECIYLIASDFAMVSEYMTGYSGYCSLNLNMLGYKDAESAIDFLSNKENWNSLLDNKLANYAIGTPDLEIFVNSWNQKHTNEKIDVIGDTMNGYDIFTNSNCSIDSDSLYSIKEYHSGLDSTLGIWISSKDTNNKIYMYADGFVSVSETSGHEKFGSMGNGSYIGIRPIVCLKPEVILKSGEGTIESPFEVGLK